MELFKNYQRLAATNSGAVEGGGVTRNLLNFDVATGVSWQAWVFCSADSTCGSIVDFSFQGGFGAAGDIRTAVGPNGGDLIAGTGPCVVSMTTDPTATVAQDSNVSIWFVPEGNYRNLPPYSENFTIAGAGSFQWLNTTGFAPFGRYKLTVWSNANWGLEVRGAAGGIYQVTPVVAPSVADQPFIISPLTRVRVTNTLANQNFAITFTE